MLGIKLNLNAQVIIRSLQPESTHEKPPAPTGAQRTIELEYQDGARLCARKATEHTKWRAQRPPSGVADGAESRAGQ
jgi:hypothetical protein